MRKEFKKAKVKNNRGETLDVLRQSVTGVVGEGLVPPGPRWVIVISLQGPTSTDEVSLTCQSRCSRPGRGPLGSPQAGRSIPTDLERHLNREEDFWPRTTFCLPTKLETV